MQRTSEQEPPPIYQHRVAVYCAQYGKVPSTAASTGRMLDALSNKQSEQTVEPAMLCNHDQSIANSARIALHSDLKLDAGGRVAVA
jgi:hypothetical protein